MSVKPAAARALALWVRAYYPSVYVQLASRVSGQSFGAYKRPLRGGARLGQDVTTDSTDVFSSPTDISASEINPPLDNSTVFDTIDPNTGAIAAVSANFTLPDITAPADANASASDLGPSQPPASAISPTVASPSVLSQVGSYLMTGGGLNALLNVGTAVINNQTSQNVLQAQVARVSAGYNPAAFGYTVNPNTGNIVPILQSSAPGVSYPLTPQLVSQFAPPQNAAMLEIQNFVSQYWLWLLIGGLALAVL